MEAINYLPWRADPDVLIQKARKYNGTEYYEYMLLYVDDCLAIYETPKEAVLQLHKFFKMQPSSIYPPNIYLGGKLKKMRLPNMVEVWTFSSSQYAQEAVFNVEKFLQDLDESMLSMKINAPLSNGYRPELDSPHELDGADGTYCQSLIGILWWMVEIGRMDIWCEVSMISSHLALPREGHLAQVFHIFAYLKKHHNSALVFDPSYPDVNIDTFPKHDWEKFYENVKESMPPDMPETLGKDVVMRCFVDVNHAWEKLTSRSCSGFIIFLQMPPIYYCSKRQNTVETSTFVSEFMSMKLAWEYIRGLWYKIRMMEVPFSDPCFVYGDNKSVLYNTTLPESTLKKKSNSIAYHAVREGVANGEWITGYVSTYKNVSYLLTKPVPGGDRSTRLVRGVL